MSPPRPAYWDERVLFMLTGPERATENLKRLEHSRYRRLYREHYDQHPAIWDQGSYIADSDGSIDRVLAESACLSPVRGDDYLDRRLSGLLSAPISGASYDRPLTPPPETDRDRAKAAIIACELRGEVLPRQRRKIRP